MSTAPTPYRRTRISKATVLVKQECANHNNGHCLEDGTRLGDERPRCLVMSGLPCSYFDRCLAPLCVRHAVWEGAPNDYFTRTHGWKARAGDLKHPHLGHDAKINTVTRDQGRQCQCGATLSKGRQKCEACRKKTTRARAHRNRVATPGAL